MARLTVFTFGYQGWGRATRDLVRAVDAVERARGFRPPVFVDARARRTARAVGFRGPAFERLVGPRRYQWMREPGPEEIGGLLDLAEACAHRGRRVIAFSSGPNLPTVARLAAREAGRRKVPLEVVAWPGGEPRFVQLRVGVEALERLEAGREHLVIGRRLRTALAGLAWGSVAEVRSGDRRLYRVVGPLMRLKEGWVLPVLWPREGGTPSRARCERERGRVRRALGAEPLRSR